MTGAARHLLPAGLVALILHTILLSWPLNPDKEILPLPLPAQRIAVSLGVKKITKKKPQEPQQQRSVTKNTPVAKAANVAPSPPEADAVQPPIKNKVVILEKNKQKIQKIAPINEEVVRQKDKVPKKKARPQVARKADNVIDGKAKKGDVLPLKANPSPDSGHNPSPHPEMISMNNAPPTLRQTSYLPEQNAPQTTHSPRKTRGIVEAKPLYRQNAKPRYPTRARRFRWQGLVLLEVEVLVDGSAGQVMLHKSSGYKLLDKAAIAAVKKWLFVPGMVKGELKKMKVIVPLNFKLK